LRQITLLKDYKRISEQPVVFIP